MTQQFQKGDLVRVAKDLGDWTAHFQCDCDAIVIGSYADQYGGSDTKSYTIFIRNDGKVSWYDEHQLNLIEPNQFDLLSTWESEEASEIKEKSDLDWIFTNGPEVAGAPHGASVQALANCFGLTNLWGSNGEGISYYENSLKTMAIAGPFLKDKDKAGWLKLCKE